MKIIIFLLFSNILLSQNLYLKNFETKGDISYANVIYRFNDEVLNYDYTNENGYLILNKNIEFNLLEISCLGFENTIIKKESLTDTVYLKSRVYMLDEVVLTNSKKVNLIGLLNEKEKVEIGFSKGLEICLFFENLSKNDLLVQSFVFNLNQKFKEKIAIRLHVYDVSKSKLEPSEEILSDNIVHILNLKNKNEVEIDLSNYSIYLPKKGAFIGIEFLGYLDDDTSTLKSIDYALNSTKVKFNDKEKLPLTFIRNSVKKEQWTNTIKLKEEFSKIIKFKNIPNASFGLKVYDID